MMDESKGKKKLSERIKNAYLKKIKRWMPCPACKTGKMAINKKGTLWVCEDCSYKLSAVEFEDDYVFWFCDECDTYLNNQEGFNRQADKHICKNCGYENDTTDDNRKSICEDCGKIIPYSEGTLCVECRRVRWNKGITFGIAAGFTALLTCFSLSASNSDDEGDIMRRDWLRSASDEELRAKKHEIQTGTDWQSGSVLGGDFDTELGAIDAINQELNQRAHDRYNSENHTDTDANYGVRREHGWYLPNDD